MAATEQDFLPFSIGAGANVMDQAAYAAAEATGFVAVGFAAGIAQSAQLNKVWRQSSVMAHVIGQFIFDLLDEDVLDNTDTAALLQQFKDAVLTQAGGSSAPLIITDSLDHVLTKQDREVALNRSSGLALGQDLQLPGLAPGESVTITDIFGNLSDYPVRVVPPTGTISNRADYTMNEDHQSATFTLYAAGVWGVKS